MIPLKVKLAILEHHSAEVVKITWYFIYVILGRSAHSKFSDPCDKAREESMKCLDKNAYNRAKCTNVSSVD